MSENEKRLTPEREKMLRSYFKGAGPIDLKGQELLAEIDALNALLAEHRAEVEGLRADVDALNRTCCESQERESFARDAALEEAAARIDDDICPDPDGFAEKIRALKAQPAERYLRESEVRRVLPYLRTVCGLSESEVADVLRRLGVDLDAKVEHPDTQRHGAQVMRSVYHTVRALAEKDTLQRCSRCGNLREEHDVAGRIQIGEVDTVCSGFYLVSP